MEEKKTNKKLWIGIAAILIIIVVLLIILNPFRQSAAEPTQAADNNPPAAVVQADTPAPTAESAPPPTEEPTAETAETAAEATPESVEEANPGEVLTAANLDQIQEAYVLNGHGGDVTEITFSPDGTLLASASVDNTVKVWNTADGSLRYTLEGHADTVLSLAFSPEGDLLLSGSRDGTVKKWQLSDGTLIDSISRMHPVRALELAFSPDGNLFAVANDIGFVELRRTDTGILFKTIVQTDSFGYKEDFVSSWGLSFTPDGESILVGAGRNCCGSSLRVYDVDTYVESEILIGMNVRIRDLVFAPDGESIGVVFLPLSVFWTVDAQDGNMIEAFEGHSYMVNSIAFSPDGSLIVSGGEDWHIYIWDTSTGEILGDLKSHEAAINSVAFSPDGTTIAIASDDATVRLWKVYGD
ncbi:MAG: WD40 repeat domain-containing protein [Anaerolineales bacterium]|nr:WD40 repeat domain-containing protein [Anaerolineales bacterium]